MLINTLKPERNVPLFADDIFKFIFINCLNVKQNFIDISFCVSPGPYVTISLGFVPSGKKLLPEPMLTQSFDVLFDSILWCHMAPPGHNELTQAK